MRRLLRALHPEVNVSDNESQRVHLTTALPQYAHPVARADAAKRLSQPARKAIAAEFEREWGFTKPQWRAQLDVTDFRTRRCRRAVRRPGPSPRTRLAAAEAIGAAASYQLCLT